MKTLKLNLLEKKEMNAVRGGDFVCAQYCAKKCAMYKGGDDKAAPKVTTNMQSRKQCCYANKKAI